MGLDRAGADGLDLQNQITSAGFGASDPTSHVAAVVEFKLDESSYMDTMSKFLEMSSSQTDKLKQLQESMWTAIFGKPEEQVAKMSDNVEKLFQNMLSRLSQTMIAQGDDAVQAIRVAMDNASRELPQLADRLAAAGVPADQIGMAMGKTDIGDDAQMRAVGHYGDIALPLREIRHAMESQHAQQIGQGGMKTPRLPTLSDQLTSAAGNNQKLQQAALQTLYSSGTPTVDTTPSMGAAGHLLQGLGAQGLGKLFERPGATFATPHGGTASAGAAIGDIGGFGYGGTGAAQMGAGQLGEHFVEHQAANSLMHSAGAQGAASLAGKLGGKFAQMIPGGGLALEALGGMGAGIAGGGLALGGLALGINQMYTGSQNEIMALEHHGKLMGYTADQTRRYLQTIAAVGNATFVSTQQMEQLRDTLMDLGVGAGYTNAGMATGAGMMAFGGMSAGQAGQSLSTGLQMGLTPYQSMNMMLAAGAGSQYSDMSRTGMINTQLGGMSAAMSAGLPGMGNWATSMEYGLSKGKDNTGYSFIRDPNAMVNMASFAASAQGRERMAARLGLNVDDIAGMDSAHGASTMNQYLSSSLSGLVGAGKTQQQMELGSLMQSGMLPTGPGLSGYMEMLDQMQKGHPLGGSLEDIQHKEALAMKGATKPLDWNKDFKKQSVITQIKNFAQTIGKPLDEKGAEEAYGQMHVRDRMNALKDMFPKGIPPQLAAAILYDPGMTDEKLKNFTIKQGGKTVKIGDMIVHGQDPRVSWGEAAYSAIDFTGFFGSDEYGHHNASEDFHKDLKKQGLLNNKGDFDFSHVSQIGSYKTADLLGQPDLGHLPSVGDPLGAGSMGAGGGKGDMKVGTLQVTSVVVSPNAAADLYGAVGKGATEAGFPLGRTPGSY